MSDEAPASSPAPTPGISPELTRLVPRDDDGPVFRAPWEASAFALAVRLIDAGVVSWPEWAAALGARLESARRDSSGDRSDDYYRHWLAALEDVTCAKGLATPELLASLKQDWRAAYLDTPHGRPVSLPPQDG
ncbi:nitrile hydratase accessory protein [Fodinicurvata sp. EGI_FJ10296]|uniref:nitrile hydratase accessory protein n=1 Tax=Fodinicurvata sp. EGI_FJ10296 TaxID=3231908 RepID=UPI003455357B